MLAAGAVARLARDAQLRDLASRSRRPAARSRTGFLLRPGVVAVQAGVVPGAAAALCPEVVACPGRGTRRCVWTQRFSPMWYSTGRRMYRPFGCPVQALLNPVRPDQPIDLKPRERRRRAHLAVCRCPSLLQARPVGVDRLHVKRVALARESGRQALVVVDGVGEVALDVFGRRVAGHGAVVGAVPRLVMVGVALGTRLGRRGRHGGPVGRGRAEVDRSRIDQRRPARPRTRRRPRVRDDARR